MINKVEKRCLVVAPLSPFPPRNGVTIPIFNYIKILSRTYKVDLLVINCTKFDVDISEKKYVDNVFVIEGGKEFGILDELLGRNAIFSITFDKDECFKDLFSRDYRFILASPISCLYASIVLRDMIYKETNSCPYIVAGISDSYALVLKSKNDFASAAAFFNTIISKLRARFVKLLEIRLLSNCKKVLVQSNNDKVFLETQAANYGIPLSNVCVLTNGVDDSLFDVDFISELPSVIKFIFIADFTSSYYREKLLWFYNKVWAYLDSDRIVLTVRGPGIDVYDDRFKMVFSSSNVIYENDFKKNLADVYKQCDILVAPIFKSYGFINKVGEAMASGKVVVGDVSAFNAIDGIESGKNCFIANTALEFRERIGTLLKDPNTLCSVGRSARELAFKRLRWDSKEIVDD